MHLDGGRSERQSLSKCAHVKLVFYGSADREQIPRNAVIGEVEYYVPLLLHETSASIGKVHFMLPSLPRLIAMI